MAPDPNSSRTWYRPKNVGAGWRSCIDRTKADTVAPASQPVKRSVSHAAIESAARVLRDGRSPEHAPHTSRTRVLRDRFRGRLAPRRGGGGRARGLRARAHAGPVRGSGA